MIRKVFFKCDIFSGQAFLSVWVACYRTCRLGITYQTSQLKPQDVSFHRVGKLSDGRWHKIALYLFPHSHLGKTAVELSVDCKMLGRKKIMPRIENLVLSSRDVVFLFAQRGVRKKSAMLTWKVGCKPCLKKLMQVFLIRFLNRRKNVYKYVRMFVIHSNDVRYAK